MKIPIYQVDAFTSKVFKGNPAAVCPLKEWLPDKIMQEIAKENNLSETAFFIKDVIGPKGSVSIVEPKNDDDISSSNIDSHTKTNQLLIHYQDRSDDGKFKFEDKYVNTSNEPNHDELCKLEQEFLLQAIIKDLDLTTQLEAVINSMKIVLAADKSVKLGKQVLIDN
mgnify:CR=1 FL=1